MNLNNFQNTKLALLKLITTEQFPQNRLPSEAELAKKMRVSIVTLRQSLTVLAAEGYITKKQGLGNFIHHSALDRNNRIDITYCVENLLKISGYAVETQLLDLSVQAPDDLEITAMRVDPQDSILQIRLLYLADGDAAALEIHRVPRKFFIRDVPDNIRIDKFDQFLWEYCDKSLAHEMITWEPVLVTDELSRMFQLPGGSPMLSWNQIIFDQADLETSHSQTFFNPKVIQPRSLRKWNFGPRITD